MKLLKKYSPEHILENTYLIKTNYKSEDGKEQNTVVSLTRVVNKLNNGNCVSISNEFAYDFDNERVAFTSFGSVVKENFAKTALTLEEVVFDMKASNKTDGYLDILFYDEKREIAIAQKHTDCIDLANAYIVYIGKDEIASFEKGLITDLDFVTPTEIALNIVDNSKLFNDFVVHNTLIDIIQTASNTVYELKEMLAPNDEQIDLIRNAIEDLKSLSPAVAAMQYREEIKVALNNKNVKSALIDIYNEKFPEEPLDVTTKKFTDTQLKELMLAAFEDELNFNVLIVEAAESKRDVIENSINETQDRIQNLAKSLYEIQLDYDIVNVSENLKFQKIEITPEMEIGFETGMEKGKYIS